LAEANKTVIALGFFDGVHRGHAELIKMAKLRAKELGAVPAVLSFDVSPESVIRGHAVPLIGSTETRKYLIRSCFGIEKIIICHFNRQTMEMPWHTFIDTLIGTYSAVSLVIGHDFSCGYRGEGRPERISDYCRERGVGCDVIPKFTLDGITVSSTYIRELITNGEIERADYFLGHPYIFAGRVNDGRKVGRRLGTPTINLEGDDPCLVIPANGVYATKVIIGDTARPAVTNIGFRPTFGKSDNLTVESFILDYNGDLYGDYLRLEFYKYLRKEKKFSGPDELRSQIASDIEAARLLFT